MLRAPTTKRHLGSATLAVIAALLASKAGACGTTSEGGRCSETPDCYLGGNMEIGTICIDEECVCTIPEQILCCGKNPCVCEWMCRYPEACGEYTGCPGGEQGGVGGMGSAATTGSAAGTGGAGGQSQAECVSAADCPQPHAWCGTATCTDGACGLTIKEGPTASQIQGDCKAWICDKAGQVVTIEAPDDVYNDGRQCTTDTCLGDMAFNTPIMNGLSCPDASTSFCFDGSCVQCVQGIPLADNCSSGMACYGLRCVPMECTLPNGQKDGPETGADCGGPCFPCFSPDTCVVDTDCFEGVCTNGTCAPPTCSDNVKNDGETGIDCGSSSCPKCPEGKGCATGKDCESGVCWAGVCKAPGCTDGLKNGTEAGLDCGGPCSPCPS